MEDRKVEEMVDTMMRLARHVEIADHKRGEIKLKFSLSAVKEVGNLDLAGMSETLPGILDTKVSLIMRTLTITYDPKIIPTDLWDEVVEAGRRPSLRAHLEDRLRMLWAGESVVS